MIGVGAKRNITKTTLCRADDDLVLFMPLMLGCLLLIRLLMIANNLVHGIESQDRCDINNALL